MNALRIESLFELRSRCREGTGDFEFWRWLAVAACAEIWPVSVPAGGEYENLVAFSLSALENRRYHWQTTNYESSPEDRRDDLENAEAAVCDEINLFLSRVMDGESRQPDLPGQMKLFEVPRSAESSGLTIVPGPDISGTASSFATVGSSCGLLLASPRPNMAAEPENCTELDPLDLRYPGGKGLSGLQQWICSLLPPHVYYCEPFAGKGGIFRLKPPALKSLLIDLDPDVITWWHRQTGQWSIDHRQSGPGFQELLSSLVDDDAGGRPRQNQRWSTAAVVGNGIEFVEAAADLGCPELLINADPPYLPEVRKKLKLYRCEMTKADHVRFLKAACRLTGPTVISGYDSRLYREALDGWDTQTRQVITRGRTLATEVVWRNAAATHHQSSAITVQYSELATNFRDRQRVARLCKRWVADFTRRPRQERRALILALLNAERSGSSDVASDDAAG